MARRVAVTGIGVVASCGVGTDAFWEGLHRPPPDGEVLRIDDFDPMPWINGNPKEVAGPIGSSSSPGPPPARPWSSPGR